MSEVDVAQGKNESSSDSDDGASSNTGDYIDYDSDSEEATEGAEKSAEASRNKRAAMPLEKDERVVKKSRTEEGGGARETMGSDGDESGDDKSGGDKYAILPPSKYYVIRAGDVSIRAIELSVFEAWKQKIPERGFAPFGSTDTMMVVLIVDAVAEIFPGSTANGMARHALLAETRHPVGVSATTTKTTMAVPVFAARAYIRAKFAERCEHMTEGLKHLASIIVTAMTDEDNYHEITRDAFMDISTKKMRARLKPSSKIPSRRYANHLRLAAGAFGASGASGAASASASAAAAAAASATTSSDRLPRSRTTTTNHSAGSYVSATGAGAAAAATVEPTAYRPPSDVTARLMRIVHEIVEITIEINKS